MILVRQRLTYDCAIATIAMACGQTYEEVFADLGHELNGQAEHKLRGISDTLVKHYLFRHGWAWQERTMNLWHGGEYRQQEPWPPAPFAASHICLVKATEESHYCAMDETGRVFDPWEPSRVSLTHPDYNRVMAVAGLFKVKP